MVARAKAVCRHCDYQPECAEWALEHREAGVWGGTSDRDRRRIRSTHYGDLPAVHLSKYELFELTQHMITEEKLTVRECAERLGLTYEHVTKARKAVFGEIQRGQWRP